MLKKILLLIGVIFLIVVIVLYFTLGQIIDSVVENAINTYGPELTKTSVHVDDVSISPFRGTGKIEGLTVGNPSGYKAPNAFTLDEIYVDVESSTLFSEEVHINKIEIISPSFVFESNILSSNIGTIISNIKGNAQSTDKKAAQASQPAGSSSSGEAAKPLKRFVINKLLVEDGVVQIGILGNSTTVKLQKIEMDNFSPNGITGAQATSKIMSIILEKVIIMATQMATHPNETAAGITNTTVNTIQGATESVGNAIGGFLGGGNKETESSK